LFLCFSVTSAV